MDAKTLYESYAYPAIAASTDPLARPRAAYGYSVAQAFYARDGALPRADVRILDLGCGTGFHSLGIAKMNPRAAVVGVDASESAIRLAEERRRLHGAPNLDFVVADAFEFLSHHERFDYVTCNDFLYFFDPVAEVLRRCRAALSPRGIIRASLHTASVRTIFLRARDALRMLGISDLPPGEAIAATRAFFDSLSADAHLKRHTWPRNATDEFILNNYHLEADKAFTLDGVLAALDDAGLTLVDMADHRRWDWDLLVDAKHDALRARLKALTRLERLRLFDAVHYHHRLYDFWCSRPEDTSGNERAEDWAIARLMGATVSLHPCLRRTAVVERLSECVRQDVVFDLGREIDAIGENFFVTSRLSRLMLLLVPEDRSGSSLMEIYDDEQGPGMPDSPEDRLCHDLDRLSRLGAVFLLEPSPPR